MYVTVDLDDPTHDKIATAWARLSAFGSVHGRVSKSGTGVHLKSGETVPQDVPTHAHARWYCLDDEKRIEADKRNSIDSNQVLWDMTDGQSAGEWQSTLAGLLARYHVCPERLPKLWSGGRLYPTS